MLEIVILAAGLGTRMKSDKPKVLHAIGNDPMLVLLMRELEKSLAATSTKQQARFNIVIGHGREQVKEAIEKLRQAGRIKTPVVYTVQEQQLGTAHAVKLATENAGNAKTVAVLNGDLPLFTSEAFTDFIAIHLKEKSAASLLSTNLEDAGQYGRIIRKGKAFIGTVESKDASKAQLKIREINGGVYLFDAKLLQDALKNLKNKNKSGEFYLPDVFNYAKKIKKKIIAHTLSEATLILGANNMKELAEAQKFFFTRIAEKHMTEGVFIAEPAHTYIGPDVTIGRGCVIGPFTVISGNSKLANDVTIGAHCELKNVVIGAKTQIKNCTVAADSTIGQECAIGPMAQLRPGTKLGNDVKIGNFVETKESTIGDETSVSHLSYLGDATVGKGVNVGCGFVTCNFDGTVRNGKRKHPSVIGDNVFIGSDCQIVAPIEIASGTIIAAGSTVTESVKEPDSLVVARTRQVVKPGYARKYRK